MEIVKKRQGNWRNSMGGKAFQMGVDLKWDMNKELKIKNAKVKIKTENFLSFCENGRIIKTSAGMIQCR